MWPGARLWKACDLGVRSTLTVAVVGMDRDVEAMICTERLCEDEEDVADLGVATALVVAGVMVLHRNEEDHTDLDR